MPFITGSHPWLKPYMLAALAHPPNPPTLNANYVQCISDVSPRRELTIYDGRHTIPAVLSQAAASFLDADEEDTGVTTRNLVGYVLAPVSVVVVPDMTTTPPTATLLLQEVRVFPDRTHQRPPGRIPPVYTDKEVCDALRAVVGRQLASYATASVLERADRASSIHTEPLADADAFFHKLLRDPSLPPHDLLDESETFIIPSSRGTVVGGGALDDDGEDDLQVITAEPTQTPPEKPEKPDGGETPADEPSKQHDPDWDISFSQDPAEGGGDGTVGIDTLPQTQHFAVDDDDDDEPSDRDDDANAGANREKQKVPEAGQPAQSSTPRPADDGKDDADARGSAHNRRSDRLHKESEDRSRGDLETDGSKSNGQGTADSGHNAKKSSAGAAGLRTGRQGAESSVRSTKETRKGSARSQKGNPAGLSGAQSPLTPPASGTRGNYRHNPSPDIAKLPTGAVKPSKPLDGGDREVAGNNAQNQGDDDASNSPRRKAPASAAVESPRTRSQSKKRKGGNLRSPDGEGKDLPQTPPRRVLRRIGQQHPAEGTRAADEAPQSQTRQLATRADPGKEIAAMRRAPGITPSTPPRQIRSTRAQELQEGSARANVPERKQKKQANVMSPSQRRSPRLIATPKASDDDGILRTPLTRSRARQTASQDARRSVRQHIRKPSITNGDPQSLNEKGGPLESVELSNRDAEEATDDAGPDVMKESGDKTRQTAPSETVSLPESVEPVQDSPDTPGSMQKRGRKRDATKAGVREEEDKKLRATEDADGSEDAEPFLDKLRAEIEEMRRFRDRRDKNPSGFTWTPDVFLPSVRQADDEDKPKISFPPPPPITDRVLDVPESAPI